MNRVELDGPHTVRFLATGGQQWAADFDPGTLRPSTTVNQCLAAD